MQLIGVDAGGTFTDTVVVTSSGQMAIGKALSTPADPAEGVIASLADAAARLGTDPIHLVRETDVFAHGTTIGLNALLTGTGAKVGLLTTQGFESTLAIAKANKVHGLPEGDLERPTRWNKPTLLVPRRLTRGIRERVDARGEIVEPLDCEDARRQVEALAAAGVEAVAVALLWSVAHPDHERQVAELVRAVMPRAHLSISHELVPKIGEYERTATVVVDAYVGPLVSSYLGRLDERLADLGFDGLFVLMRMGGGVLPVEMARRMPVHTLHSGPVGGVAAAAALGRHLGHHDIITTDVGGTSFDVGLVRRGDVLYAAKPMIERQALAIPVVDVTSIGTGGGSIAWIDPSLDTLRVGPASAGAVPGPACYGRGGELPTVTDAAVLLGYIDRLGGQLQLDLAAAHTAITRYVAEPLGLDTYAAADGVLQVACEQMRDLIRRTTVQRGHDPSDFALYAFGGAGPQYAGRYASGLGVTEVVIPGLAAEFSAFGAVASDLKATVEQDVPPGDLYESLPRLNDLLVQLETSARRQLDRAEQYLRATARHDPVVTRTVGLRFYRQIHRIDVPAPPGPVDADVAKSLLAGFRTRYEEMVGPGTARAETPVEVVTVGVEVVLPVPLVLPRPRPVAAASPVRSRPAWFEGETRSCPVFRWHEVGAGQEVDGPAFIESDDTTVVVYPDQSGWIDELGNVRIRVT
jgi:N-methylhydantoinase A